MRQWFSAVARYLTKLRRCVAVAKQRCGGIASSRTNEGMVPLGYWRFLE